MSSREVSSSQEIRYILSQNPQYINPQSYRSVINKSIVDTKNAIGFPSIDAFANQIPNDDVKYLYDRLIEVSIVSREQLDELEKMLDVQFNPQFSEDSWNCTICQKKKLDYSRGCGYLPENKRDPDPILPRIAGKVVKQCPISTLDPYVTNQASMANNLMDAGLMPEDGGLGNQTEWFIRAALLYKRKIAEAERNAMNKHKTK